MELENPDSEATKLIRVEIQKALDEDRSEAIVLGCAGMIDLASELSKEFGVPVIDGVTTAAKAGGKFSSSRTTNQQTQWLRLPSF